MKKIKKELLIFIPGARGAETYSTAMQKLISFLSLIIPSFQPIYKHYVKLWKQKLQKKSREVFVLHWDGGITGISKFFAVRRLKRIVNHYKNTHDVKIVGISLGGDIALEAEKSLGNSVKKIILVAPVIENKKERFNKTKIVNIYSPADRFVKFASTIYAPVNHGMKLNGEDILNLPVKNMDHLSFCLNKLLKSGKFKGKSVIETINTLLR